MNDYLLGCDVLGAVQPQSTIKVQDVTPPSMSWTSPSAPAPAPTPAAPDPFFGPSMSSGTVYTDAPTIRAVQKKLAALGYFHGTVDGKFGPQTESALFNFSGQHGPPDDVVLGKLGLRGEVSFTDDEVDSMVVQAKTATTPAQVQVIAAKIDKLTANAPNDVKAEVAAAKQAAAQAKTPEQAQAASEQLQKATTKLKKWPAWKIAAVAGGSAAGVGLLLGLVTLLRRR